MITPSQVPILSSGTLVVGDSGVRDYAQIQNLGPGCVYFSSDQSTGIAGYRVAAGDSYVHQDEAMLWACVSPGATAIVTILEATSNRIAKPRVLGGI